MTEHHLPANLRYTPEHEWVLPPGDGQDGDVQGEGGQGGGGQGGDGAAPGVRVGITAYAQAELGDIVYVSLPEVGAEVSAGQTCGEVESTKSVSDLFAPVTGTVVARNEALEGSPELVNSDPYGDGWLLEIIPEDPAAVAGLLDADAYRASLG
jgi:glycine cleavage system H protein